ncbi:HAD family hydrolase [Actinosynnema sp. NPDC059335]|uniref:HAD family hydrolase n=1 Tax=Actinosynnema sp. NPDC059335 TaxID=3346804 RepID=UPI003673057D
MSPRHRLAAIDLDGTLLRRDYTLSPRNEQALAALREAGTEVVFVTARHPAAVRDYAVRLGLEGEAICCVGSAVCALPSCEVTWSAAIPAEAAATAARRLRAAFPRLHLGWVLPAGPVGYQHGYPPPLLLGESFFGDPTAIDGPVLKMWLAGGDLDGTVPAGLAEAVRGLVDIAHVGPGFVDLVAPGATKVGTLAELARRRGLSARDVVAFGDTAADLDMIRWAGHGVVMANADAALHPLADEVAPDCDDDGVAVVLERLCAEEVRVP